MQSLRHRVHNAKKIVRNLSISNRQCFISISLSWAGLTIFSRFLCAACVLHTLLHEVEPIHNFCYNLMILFIGIMRLYLEWLSDCSKAQSLVVICNVKISGDSLYNEPATMPMTAYLSHVLTPLKTHMQLTDTHLKESTMVVWWFEPTVWIFHCHCVRASYLE